MLFSKKTDLKTPGASGPVFKTPALTGTPFKKGGIRLVVNHAGVFAAILVFTFAQIDARISPFMFAFLFASIYLPVNRIAVTVFAFLCSLFVFQVREDLFCSLFACGVFLAVAFILPRMRARWGGRKKWQKLKLEYVILIFAYAVSGLLNIIFSLETYVALYRALIGVLVGSVFLVACIVFIAAARTRRAKIPWTVDQKICLGIFVIIFALGLGGFGTIFDVHKFVSVFVILAAVAWFNVKAALVFGVCLGLGKTFVDLDLIYVAIYALLSLAALSFKSRYRFYSVIAVLVADVTLYFYFEAYYDVPLLWVMLPTVLACALVLVLPRALARYFDFSRGSLSGYLVSKNTINKNRAGIYGRLNNLSEVFNEMQHIYKGLVQGSVPMEDSAKMLGTHIIENVCDSCPSKRNCMRDASSAGEVREGIQKLGLIGLQRGAVNFLDLPSSVSMKCTRLNSVLNIANNYVERIKSCEKTHRNLDASKVLMAGLLSGISRLCRTFAEDACASVVFDVERAERIKDELLQNGIAASDCLITKSSANEYSVSVLVSRTDSPKKEIEQAIGKICGHKMQVDEIVDGETAGFSIVTVKTAPRFALTFGVAQVAKNFNPKCGDTFSFLKVTNEKTMMALCDGMGAGERAERASVLALSLVENFYKAGFPNEIIMTSVNQLLTITGQEVFSALDVAVFNLADGCVNFVKVGACDGFVKRARDIEVIEAGSLPLGIVEEMSPKITRAVLSGGDMVILCSDGVGDGFGDRVTLANYINNISFETPQQYADEIIRECLNRTNRIAADDCTVLVARVAER